MLIGNEEARLSERSFAISKLARTSPPGMRQGMQVIRLFDSSDFPVVRLAEAMPGDRQFLPAPPAIPVGSIMSHSTAMDMTPLRRHWRR